MPAAPDSPEAVLRRHPGAAHLGIYDGRIALGLVLDTKRPERGSPAAPSFAWRSDDTFMGQYPTRRLAVPALGVEPGR